MISVLLYGRNDSYGYNLHKRAAVSINCIAELLAHPDDEILFVDYNTPDDFPTFPEAIHDTLTTKAKSLLRIFRVRQSFHDRYRQLTHLIVLEPICRNIAARRSNPANRWLLSTNTDIVFVPQTEHNLSSYSTSLPPGIYHAPRLEIPETLWELLDRSKPEEIIQRVGLWGRSLHLNDIVTASPIVRYDGPGDFQLLEREVFFDVSGFDESMLLGWHVDSNIAARLRLIYGDIGDAGGAFFAYHCDHTRQMTPAHRHDRKQNSEERYVHAIVSPRLPQQAKTWGAPDEQVEEIRLDGKSNKLFLEALTTTIGDPLTEPYRSSYTSEGFDTISCDFRHILPYLADLLFALPRTTTLAWFGESNSNLTLFAKVWTGLGFERDILIDEGLSDLRTSHNVRSAPVEELVESSSLYIFDYAPDSCRHSLAKPNAAVVGFTLSIAKERSKLLAGHPPSRRFVGVNAINTSFEGFFQCFVSAGATPYSARLRHGFALPPECGEEDWLKHLQLGASGQRSGSFIENQEGEIDYICYGPYRALLPGRYRLTVHVDPRNPQTSEAKAILRLVAKDRLILVRSFRGLMVQEFYISRELGIGPPLLLETTINSANGDVMQLKRLGVELLSSEEIDHQPNFWPHDNSILDFLFVGSIGYRQGEAIIAGPGAGHLCYGPYWSLGAGSYCAKFQIASEPLSDDAVVVFEVIHQNSILLVEKKVVSHELADCKAIDLPFELTESSGGIEFRVFTNGVARLQIKGLMVDCG